eukprot:m.139079 g.139079  ORF g.139079 m.139079 type:complete len:135 (+) comp38266_c0_seq8:90-494(+)
MSFIPTIDFSRLSLSEFCIDWDAENVKTLCEKLDEAFRNVGFVFLTNFGIPDNEVKEIFSVYDKFFEQPFDVKNAHRRPEKINNGYVALKRERIDPTKPTDLKEAFQTNFISQVSRTSSKSFRPTNRIVNFDNY